MAKLHGFAKSVKSTEAKCAIHSTYTFFLLIEENSLLRNLENKNHLIVYLCNDLAKDASSPKKHESLKTKKSKSLKYQ